MITKIQGTNIKLTDGMQTALTGKLSFLEKFLKEEDKVKVKVSKEAEKIKLSLLFTYGKKDVKLEHDNKDFYICVDELCAIAKNKISKMHAKMTDRHKTKMDNTIDESDIINEDDLEL